MVTTEEMLDRFLEAPSIIQQWVEQLLSSHELRRVLSQNRHHQVDCTLFARKDRRVMHPRLTVSLLDDGRE